jgi:hypothetical protein
MEYIKVVFSEVREVIVDDVASGQHSGNIIELDAGHHVISLEVPLDYKPIKQEIILENTSVLDPMEVPFEKI